MLSILRGSRVRLSRQYEYGAVSVIYPRNCNVPQTSTLSISHNLDDIRSLFSSEQASSTSTTSNPHNHEYHINPPSKPPTAIVMLNMGGNVSSVHFSSLYSM
jgi:hypothetical protein